jgi:hypothetical protein
MAAAGGGDFSRFMDGLRRQERMDRRYVLRRGIIPVSAGIVILMGVLALRFPPNWIAGAGGVLAAFGLTAALGLFIRQYVDISKESFGASVREFLDQKERRLRSWKSTPILHHAAFACFAAGDIMMLVGIASTKPILTDKEMFIYIGSIAFIMLVSWGLGEILYRKRHRRRHGPLLDLIAGLKEELAENR